MKAIKKTSFETTSFSLHLIAMLLMLIDHIGALFFPKLSLLRCIGRVSFPIFAFLAVEGYLHTKNLKKYLTRLFIFAVISEVPYDMFMTGNFIDFRYQNVIWTLLLGIITIYALQHEKERFSDPVHLIFNTAILAASFALSRFLNLDYGIGGICTILIFFLFRGRSITSIVYQVIGIFITNTLILNSRLIGISLFGISISFPRQIFALLCFIPILLYKGNPGRKSVFLRYLFYCFYPLHLLVLVGIRLIIIYG